MIKQIGNWQAALDWLTARRQQAKINAAGTELKAGNLRGAIQIFESVLPALKDRSTRALVLQRFIKARLQLAHRLSRADKARAAQREYRGAIRLLGQEVANGSLSPGGSISLISFTLQRLEHYQQTAWISELRVTVPPLGRHAKAPADHLETMVITRSLSTSSAQQLVSDIAPETAPLAWWMTMHDLLYRQGFARAAIAAKQAAAISFLARAGSGSDSAMHLAAAICLHDRDRIESVIGVVDDQALKRDGWMALGEIGRARALHGSLQSVSDRRFAHWLDGKSVAVVGPARNSLGNGEAIDTHDRVIRTNFIASDAFRSAASMIGSRTDAAYYNSIFLQRQPKAVVDTLKRERVEFTMLRTPVERVRIGWETRGRRTRAYYFTPSVFMGRGFAMRHILHDLALMPAEQVKCYGSDFFLGADSHFSGYAVWRHAFEHAESYIVHDPLDCWRFMKRLLEAGVMSADAVLDRILRMDEREFILALERRLRGDEAARPDDALQ